MLWYLILAILPMICPVSAYSGSNFKAKERPSELYPSYIEQLPSLAGQTVAITGASRGLGYVTALTCARKGAEVVLLSRQSEVAKKALYAIQLEASKIGAPPPIFVECDLLDFANCKKAAKMVKEMSSVAANGLDVLCCNAGIMLQKDVASKDGFDVTISTNILSHFLLMRELMPELERAARRKGDARVVNMSSGSGFGPPEFNPVYFTKRGGNLGGAKASYDRYHQSKLANLCFASALDDKLRANGSNVKAMACTPGVCGTDMFLHATTMMRGTPIENGTRDQVPSAEDGSLSQIRCIFDPHVESGDLWGPSRDTGGLPAKMNISPPNVLVNENVKDMLWQLCEDAIGEQFEI